MNQVCYRDFRQVCVKKDSADGDFIVLVLLCLFIHSDIFTVSIECANAFFDYLHERERERERADDHLQCD